MLQIRDGNSFNLGFCKHYLVHDLAGWRVCALFPFGDERMAASAFVGNPPLGEPSAFAKLLEAFGIKFFAAIG